VALAIVPALAPPAHGALAAAARSSFTAAATDSMPPQEAGVIEIGPSGVIPPSASEPSAETKTVGRTVAPARRSLSGFEAPKWVMTRSLLVPGWGQLHNGSWIKALGIATGEVLLVTRMVDDNQALDEINQDIAAARAANDQAAEAVAVEQYNSRLDQLTRRQWLFAAVLIYSMLDAYIDAHFRDFDIEFRHDPALPGGVPPSGKKQTGLMTLGETRLALRWSF
jgi:DNA-binding FrmR family transcriptional regulator